METPLTLLYSQTSPYVRKVLLLIHEGGIASHIALRTISPWDKDNPVAAVTPTGTIPALLVADQPGLELLSDSDTICAYLIERFCLTQLLPPSHKYQIWQMVVVANKIMSMVVQHFLECNKRDEHARSAYFLARWDQILEKSLVYLEAKMASLTQDCTLAHLAIVTALAYCTLRYDEFNWQSKAPQLADWYVHFSKRSTVQITKPPSA